MKKKVFLIVFVMFLVSMLFTVSSVTAENLLANPGAESGDMTGWTVLSNGGIGWGIWGVDTFAYEGPHSGDHCFLTSYDWDTRSQLIDLLSLGYDAAFLDAAPRLYAEEWFGQGNPYDIGRFYLKVQLLDTNQNLIASYDSGEETTTWNGSGPASWSSLNQMFNGYGQGLRYIYWEDGGKDSNRWGSYYGAKLDDAFLSICVPPPANMVSWWNAEGDANDIIGTNNGTLMNGATFAPGKVDQAFSLAGTGDYVDAGTSNEFNFNNGAGDFTIDAWINLTALPLPSGETSVNSAMMVNKGTFNPFSGWGFYVYRNWRLGFGSFGVGGVRSAENTITAGSWAHVAVTKQGGAYKLYKNGIELPLTLEGSDSFQTSTAPLKIGSDFYGTTAYGEIDDTRFNGLLDEVEIFNRALSAEEIAAIYNAGSAGKCVQYSVTADANGSGAGNVASNVGGINYDYPANNTGTTSLLNENTNVVVTATAEPSTTASWNGTCAGAGGVEAGNGTGAATCTFASLDSDKTATVTFVPFPDLIVSYLPTATAGKVGSLIRRLSVKYRVMNQGTANAVPSKLDFYLSRDTALNAGDVYAGTVNIPALAPGAEAPLPYGAANFLLPTPASAVGTWKVLGVADANDDNAESDETNNVVSTGAVVMK